MPKTKKLLIVSCSTGSGHFRAAEALRLTAQKLYPEAQVLHIDLADYLSGLARIIGVSSYNSLVHKIPQIYKLIYFLTDRPLTQKFLYFIKPILQLGAKKFLKKVADYAPDCIISTQFTPQLILPKKSATPLDTIITDYHAHRIWLAPNVRNFFVASETTKKELSRLCPDFSFAKNRGSATSVDTEVGTKSRILDSDESESGEKLSALSGKIIVSGIPIHPRFTAVKDTSALKIKLGIDNDWPTVLVMPMSRGGITAKEAVNTIFSYNKNINVVAISGRDNQRTFDNLKNIKDSRQNPAPDPRGGSVQGGKFIIMKQAENIDEWMRVADIIVGKAGGLAITEAMYLQKPLIIINPIPGQEDYNTAYLEKNHLGLKANSSDDLAKKIQLIISHPEMIQKKPHPNAGEIILKNILAENFRS